MPVSRSLSYRRHTFQNWRTFLQNISHHIGSSQSKFVFCGISANQSSSLFWLMFVRARLFIIAVDMRIILFDRNGPTNTVGNSIVQKTPAETVGRVHAPRTRFFLALPPSHTHTHPPTQTFLTVVIGHATNLANSTAPPPQPQHHHISAPCFLLPRSSSSESWLALLLLPWLWRACSAPPAHSKL